MSTTKNTPRSALKVRGNTPAMTPGDSSGSQSSRIRVVIRVRPLSDAETRRGCKCALERRSDQQFTVWDPAIFEFTANGINSQHLDPSCWSRNFAFDDVLWSMDKNDDYYASQDTVYDRVAEPLVGMIMDGFNCCVFAYGQTGAGKCYDDDCYDDDCYDDNSLGNSNNNNNTNFTITLQLHYTTLQVKPRQ